MSRKKLKISENYWLTNVWTFTAGCTDIAPRRGFLTRLSDQLSKIYQTDGSK